MTRLRSKLGLPEGWEQQTLADESKVRAEHNVLQIDEYRSGARHARAPAPKPTPGYKLGVFFF